MQEGIILRAHGGFYYVRINERTLECKIRGRIRFEGQRVLPGDRVRVQSLNTDKGIIEEILPRSTELLRPSIANADQMLIVFAFAQPDPAPYLLDRLLVLTEAENLTPLIVLNKADLVTAEVQREFMQPYQEAGYPILAVSTRTGLGVSQVQAALAGKISVLAGPSGVGKSSLLNAIKPGLSLRTGAVSAKTSRGKHTTRLVELLPAVQGGLVADTPGFSVLSLPAAMPEQELAGYFREFEPYNHQCRFNSCLHWKEPDCQIKEALDSGEISPKRYASYLTFLQEIREQNKNKKYKPR